jgi:hypothetical protein
MAVMMKAWSLNFLDESSVLLLFERKKASWVADLLLVFTGRKNEELQVAAKVLVEFGEKNREEEVCWRFELLLAHLEEEKERS